MSGAGSDYIGSFVDPTWGRTIGAPSATGRAYVFDFYMGDSREALEIALQIQRAKARERDHVAGIQARVDSGEFDPSVPDEFMYIFGGLGQTRSPRATRGTRGAIVASGAGGVAPMRVVRIIRRGERIADIVNEGKALTFTTGNEHALVKLATGERALVSGGPGGILFAPGQVTIIFGHTHPTSAPPSAADSEALRSLGQSQQTVYHGGQVTKVRP